MKGERVSEALFGAPEAEEIMRKERTQADQRMRYSLKQGTSPAREQIPERGRATEEVADMFGTNRRYVEEAERLKEGRPGDV